MATLHGPIESGIIHDLSDAPHLIKKRLEAMHGQKCYVQMAKSFFNPFSPVEYVDFKPKFLMNIPHRAGRPDGPISGAGRMNTPKFEEMFLF